MFSTTLGRITVLAVLLATFGTGLFLIAAWSVNDALYYKPELQVTGIDTEKQSAKAVMIFDVETGAEIASKNATEVLSIASLTKLVAASVFYAKTDLNASTTLLWRDLNTEGESGLHYNEEYTHRELIYPLLLASSNDAAAAMLRVEPELVSGMEEYVVSLGLTNTKFSDTSGLSDQNVSTALELAVLARALFAQHPHIFDITRLQQFIGVHTGWMNNNPLVTMEGYKGGKNGFTYAAHKTDIAFFSEKLASGQERTIGYVLLGSDDIIGDIEHLRSQVQQNVSYQ